MKKTIRAQWEKLSEKEKCEYNGYLDYIKKKEERKLLK